MNPPIAAASFDFTVTDIHYVVEKNADSVWKAGVSEGKGLSDWHVLSQTTGGSAQYHIADKHYSIGQGDVLFFPKYVPRDRVCDPANPWAHIVAQYHVRYIGDADETLFDHLDHVFHHVDQTRVTSLFQELLHAWACKHTGYLLRCRSRIMEILYILIVHSLERKTLHLRMIETLTSLMAENDHKFYTIGELSRKAGVSPSYLCHIFKKTTGMTIIQYQNRIKIGKARDLLLSGECNVSTAAERLGFNDNYYFSRLFKKVTGATPSAEIKRMGSRS